LVITDELFGRSATSDWVHSNLDASWLNQHAEALMGNDGLGTQKRKWLQIPLGASKKSAGEASYLSELPLEHHQGALPLCTSYSLMSALYLFGDKLTHDYIEHELQDIQTNMDFTDRER
jgi:hypothetical protein